MTADRSLIEARDTLVRRRDELNEAITALDRVIGTRPAQSGRNGAGSGARTGGGRGARTDAVVELLKAQPGEGMSPTELAQALEARGVPLRSEDPPRAARAAGNRARAREPKIKFEDGQFVYRSNESEPARLAVDAADEAGFQTR